MKKQAKYVSKALSGVVFLLMICALVPLSISIVKYYSKSDQTPTQSVIAQPYKNHSDYNKLLQNISEYDPDKYEELKWIEFFFEEDEESETAQTQPEEEGTIRQITYGVQDGGCFVKLTSGAQIKNCTTQTSQCLYAQSNLLPDYRIDLDGTPQVLIIHTHTTESYEESETNYYNEDFNARTADNEKNVVAIGNEIENALNSVGIGVIHDTTLHDYPSYTGSYERSAQTIKTILEQNPTIKVVLDIHRDSITSLDGARIAPVIEIDGQKAAQAMIISGCDDGTMNMPNFMQNLRLACLIQNCTENSYPGLMRPILFDYRKYNQDLTTGSLLIEVGSAANSLDQAKYSGSLLGESIAQALLSISSST